jgi:hypothetical protein
MLSSWLKKLVPHLIAVGIFLIIAVIYCAPALQDKVVKQSDITQWKGSIQQSVEYKETHGQYPLWTNSVFGGMPAFSIGYPANNVIPWIAHKIFSLGLPTPIQFFFLACVAFYFLCMVLRLKPYVGVIGALGFGYATYNPVIISAGHDTQMWSMAYMPAFIGSLILIYEKKYWIGAALTALFTSVLIAMNHPQIAYYGFIVAVIMTIFYAVRWIRNKEWNHLAKVAVFTIVGAVTGLLTNAVTVMATYEYQKETIRGGTTLAQKDSAGIKSITGLDKNYAFSYSLQIPEPFVMMVPRMYGGSNDNEEVSQEKSKAVEALIAFPKELQQLQQQLPLTHYWGGLVDSGLGTSGPPYVGAIIIFLAILGMFILDNKHKWWILTGTLLAVVMSWGGFFESFNILLYKYLPLFNKFRAPSMVLVIPQMLLPLLAALAVNKIATTEDKKTLLPSFKKSVIATGAVFVVLLLLYMSLSYLSKGDKGILAQFRDGQNAQLYPYVDSFFDGLKADRKSLFIGDIFRSLGFIAVALLLVFFALRNSIKPLVLSILLSAFVLIDLITVDLKYLGKDDYQDQLENEGIFMRSQTDNELLRDTSFYRVLNLSGNPFAENFTSYHYNSIGGYHPAKLSLYQDVIESVMPDQIQNVVKVLQTNPALLPTAHAPVLNMLNTKYFLQKNGYQTAGYWKNDAALGNVWFVKTIRYVKDAHEEIDALNTFNPRDTALVQESFQSQIPFQPQFDSAASIRLVKNDNDLINYTSSSTTNQFAVFSEIYYTRGWKAFIDGKETPIVKVNYLLRGLAVPAGNHAIEFRFAPEQYNKGKKLTSIFSIVLLLLIAAALFMEWRASRNTA